MKDLRKRILLELLVTPMTMIPFMVGATSFMLSFVFGGFMAFVAFVSTLIGFGALLTNMTFNMKGISERALRQWRNNEKQKQEEKLNALDMKLKRTKDTSDDENHLRNMRVLYKQFCEDVENRKISEHTPPDMLAQVDQMFNACVHSLEQSYDIYRTSRKMTGEIKGQLLNQRKEIIDNVGESVTELANAMSEVRSLRLKSSTRELDKIRDNLSRSLQICQNRDAAVVELEDDMSALEKYADEYDIN